MSNHFVADITKRPVLIVGIDNIAAALGIGSSQVKKNLLSRPSFPACQIAPGGPWVTTYDKLTSWAAMAIPDPLPSNLEESRNRTAF